MHTFAWPDINECAKDNGGCHAKRQCINSAGSMKCADCAAGWANDGAKGCKGLCLLVDWSALIGRLVRLKFVRHVVSRIKFQWM